MCKLSLARLILQSVFLIIIGLITQSALAQSVQVAAASSYRTIWPELSRLYEDSTDIGLKVSFASSGLLTTQIQHGAPFDLFLSADPSFIDRLYSNGNVDDLGVTIGYGTLALVASDSAQPLTLELVAASLRQNKKAKIAIANPKHAPYGIAARDMLVNSQIWPLDNRQILYAENAAQALHYAQQRLTQFAIVPTGLLKGTDGTLGIGNLATELYSPVEHRMVILDSSNQHARHFYDWLQHDQAKQLLSSHGFTTP